ncbi:MAG: hypothetical protein EG824_11760 [Deltaproteobacteria bacterium]|nr:hypothetical protein [Deltaproteobacteria bacterium]
MKIYLFNMVTGAYLGEDFADADPSMRGAYIIPDDATTIPPPKVESGQMPFFNVREQRWEIRPNSVVRRSLSRDKL